MEYLILSFFLGMEIAIISIYIKFYSKFVNNDIILSPVTHSNNVSVLSKIFVKDIQSLYNSLNIDVCRYFKNHEYLFLCKCIDTGYEFFYPNKIEGDSEFYSHLEKIPWYYIQDKWEFNQTEQFIYRNDKVLEIGSGNGAFLKRIQSKNISITGLEFNQSAITYCKSIGLDVSDENLNTHSKQKKDYYDVICAFQVLEHVYEVKEFIEDCLFCLKPNGKLIISVPNYTSFIKYDKHNPLEHPPHHIGRWNEDSIKKIEEYFPVKCSDLLIENLADYHKEYFVSIMSREFEKINKENLFQQINSNDVKGHTMISIFIKSNITSQKNALDIYKELKNRNKRL